MKSDVVLLPGLHGSTVLYDRFIALAPPWAVCRPMALPLEGDQSFGGLADALEARLRSLEGFILFAESFSGPIAARLAKRLGSKVALLVLSNPLVEPPIPAPILPAYSLLHSRLVRPWAVAVTLTGGDRRLAEAALREVRALPRDVFERRMAAAYAAKRRDLAERLDAPLLGIVGTKDRLLSPALFSKVLREVPFAMEARIEAPHLAAQTAPYEVWAAISEEFERAA